MPSVKVKLPAGALGISFKGKQPTVMGLNETSPMVGKVKEGYVVDALYLKDGTEFKGMNTSELVKTLGKYSKEEGRKLRFHMKLPDTTTVTIPAGEIRALIGGEIPTIMKLERGGGPLRKKVRTGLMVDSLELEDGMKIYGYPTEELLVALKDDEANEGRTLTLKNPATTTFSDRKVVLPDTKTCDIPIGDLGLSLDGHRHAEIVSLTDDSPLRGSFRVGMIFDALTMPDGTEYAGLSANDLLDFLDSSSDVEGRSAKLCSPTSKLISKKATTKVVLPKGTLSEMGLVFAGTPATIKEISEDSPLASRLRSGLELLTICDADEMEYDELDINEIDDMVEETAGQEGRWMLFENKVPMPDELVLKLPTGKLGVSFKKEKGSSIPIISKVSDTSPVRDEIIVGMAVDSLALDSVNKLVELDTSALAEALIGSADVEGRVLTLKHPVTGEISKLPDTKLCHLPSGRLATTFKGEVPIIRKMDVSSPMAGEFELGLAVDTLTLADGTALTGLTTKQLVKELKNSADTEGRTMLLKNPKTQTMSGKDVKLPDEIVCNIPPGKLGVTFRSHPPKVSTISETSAVKDTFRVGMVVDSLAIDSANKYVGLDTKGLIEKLKDSADKDGRVIVLRNPDAELSSMPDSIEVALTPGKLGTTFKAYKVTGPDGAVVSEHPIIRSIDPSSPMAGEFQVGMCVDMLTLEDGTVITGMSTKELVMELKNSSTTEGRTVLLKNPATQTLSPKEVILPDEKEVMLPPGRLGVSFKRTPPTITSLSEDSPMKYIFRVGMVVDTLEIPGENGGQYAGLTAKELVALLGDSKETTGRKILMKNPQTATLTERSFRESPDAYQEETSQRI